MMKRNNDFVVDWMLITQKNSKRTTVNENYYDKADNNSKEPHFTTKL